MEQRQEFDKNTLIGLGLIVIIILGFFYFNQPGEEEIQRRKAQTDSSEIKRRNTPHLTTPQTVTNLLTTAKDSLSMGIFTHLKAQIDTTITIENNELKIVLSSRGGRPINVELKNHYKWDRVHLVELLNDPINSWNYSFTTFENKLIESRDLQFSPEIIQNSHKANNDSIIFTAALNDSQYIRHIYSLNKYGYRLNMTLELKGFDNILSANSNAVSFEWNQTLMKQETHAKAERERTTAYYKLKGEDPDYIPERSAEKEEFKTPVEWISFKQQYFNSAIIGLKPFEEGGNIETKPIENDSLLKHIAINLYIPIDKGGNSQFPLSFFWGPNHYQTLLNENIGLERVVYLGWGIFGYVNRYVVIPIFNFLDDYISSYGIIILLLTLIIKTALFPLVFKSFKSSAKMRLLKPEVDQIKEKFSSDFQKQQQETMNLYRKAGVNPMGGCVPMLLQLPILFAMFQFFPSAFELRHQEFLWASDLSMYDSIWEFGNIPFINYIYGNHVSLFTLLMTISSIIFTLMNNQMTGVSGQMKYIGLLMPVIFLGFFNNYASGLTWYYFLSNIITIGQQLLIRRFIDEKAIHTLLQENKKKPVKKSSFQKKLEDMARKRGIDPNQLRK